MRILLTAPLYGRGGTETHLLHLCNLLVQNGHEVILACRYADRSAPLVQLHQQLGVRRLSTPFDKHHKHYRRSTLFALVFWPWYLLTHRVDLIITLELSHFLLFLKSFQKPGGHTLYLRAGLPPDSSASTESNILRQLDGVIAESMLQANACHLIYSLPALGIPLLGNIATAIPPRPPLKHRRIIRLAYLGRYDRKKGIYRLLEIWGTICNDDVMLEYYGHGAEQRHLEEQVASRGLTSTVKVNGGWITPDELAEIMSNIDLIILPSEEEGLPVVLMEAMAYGVPFVATDVGAVRTYAEENPDVRVVPLDNQHIAAAISEMVQAIRDGRIDGRRLQQYYQTHYAYNKLASAWLDAVEHIETWT